MVDLQSWLTEVIATPSLHAKWLNTLSYMENCGAKLIASCEHPTMVQKEMLKHAAEEFRHAYFFKQQIAKLDTASLPTYQQHELLGSFATRHYLYRLNVQISRLLKDHPHKKVFAYLLVTYAIEVRAEMIYPLYQELLKEAHSPITVAGIIREEAQHLADITGDMQKTGAKALGGEVCEMESRLFETWLRISMLQPIPI